MLSKDYNTTFQTFRLSGSLDENNFLIETKVLYLTEKCFFYPLTGGEIVVNDKTEERTENAMNTEIIDIIASDEVRIDNVPYNIDLIRNYSNDHLETTLIKRN